MPLSISVGIEVYSGIARFVLDNQCHVQLCFHPYKCMAIIYIGYLKHTSRTAVHIGTNCACKCAVIKVSFTIHGCAPSSVGIIRSGSEQCSIYPLS